MSVGKAELRQALESAAQRGILGSAPSWQDAKDLYAVLISNSRYKVVGFWEFLKLFRNDESELRRLRDYAIDNFGCDQRGYVPKPLDCPGRHWARPFTAWDDGFVCSLCTRVVPKGSRCLGCRICDYDVCADCVERILAGATNAGCDTDQASGPPVTLAKRQLRKILPSHTPRSKTCPKGHPLKLSTAMDDRFFCDLCGSDQPKDASIRSCEHCGYDVCLSCFGEVAIAVAPSTVSFGASPHTNDIEVGKLTSTASGTICQASSKMEDVMGMAKDVPGSTPGKVLAQSPSSLSAAKDGRCPKGHDLLPVIADDEYFVCNECCLNLDKGCSLQSCGPCGFDVCLPCLGKEPRSSLVNTKGKAKAKTRRGKPHKGGKAVADAEQGKPLTTFKVVEAVPPVPSPKVDPASIALGDSTDSDF